MGGRFLILGVIVAALTACKSRSSSGPPEPAPAAAPVVAETRTPRIDGWLTALADPSNDIADEASLALGKAADAHELTPGEVIALLRGAARSQPRQLDILTALEEIEGNAAYVAVIEESLPSLRDGALPSAFRLMVRSPGGVDAAVRLVPRFPSGADGLSELADKPPPAAERARLFTLAHVPLVVDVIGRLALHWANRKQLDRAELIAAAPDLAAGYRAAAARLAAMRAGQPELPGDDAARAVGEYLDLFYFLPADAVAADLVAAARDPDPMIAVFAVLTQLRSGATPEPAALEAVMRHDHARWVAHAILAQDDKVALMPERWRTQEAFARADLANWLSFETELGKAPDEMTLMKVVPVDAGADGKLNLYVFKYRTKPPHWAAEKGWMAGVAGPYRRTGGPYVSGPNTFSSFEPAASMTAAQHAGDVAEILASWRAAQP